MKETAIKVLKDLKYQGVNAFIAGGYVRDTLLGRDTKDIDVFILTPDPLAPLTKAKLSDYGPKKTYGGSGDNLREDVVFIEKYDDYNLDIIHLDQPTVESACNNFDVSVCQAYAKLNREENDLEYYVSDDFREYETRNVIYIYSNIKTTEAHLTRVKDKFPCANYKYKEMLKEKNNYSKY